MTAVSLDTLSQGKNSTAGSVSLSWSHTCSASAGLLVIGVGSVRASSGSPFMTGATYNGVALSSISSAFNATSSTTATAELWYLVNPASGANTISVSFANADRAVGFGASFLNVSASSAIGAAISNQGHTSNATLTNVPANGTNDYVLGIIGACDGGNNATISSPLLSISTTQGNGASLALGGLDTEQATGATSTLTAAFSAVLNWAAVGAAILAAAGGGGGGGSTGTGSFYFLRRRR